MASINKTSGVPSVLEFDFPTLHIGVAEYEDGPTGVSVFYFPGGASAAFDARGGAVASFNTERLHMGHDRPTVQAICFAGGASYGLESASGVLAELLARRGYDADWANIPTVCGAVVYDFRGRRNAIYPDKELGRAALRRAQPGRFPLGARGGGRFVHAGKFFGGIYGERAGQGAAFVQLGPTKVAVFTVVNSVGVLLNRSGQVVCGNLDPETGKRTPIGEDLRDGTAERKRRGQSPADAGVIGGNTTLSLVVTNQAISHRELQRLAMQVHTSMARGIHPFHTEHDGDLLFALTTSEIENANLVPADLTAWASELAWDAILASVPRP